MTQKGQLRAYHVRKLEDEKNTQTIQEEVKSIVHAFLLLQKLAKLDLEGPEAHKVSFNASGVQFYDEEYLKPEYGSEDGYTEFYTLCGLSLQELESKIMEHHQIGYFDLTKDIVIDYITRFHIQPEIDEIKMLP